MVTNHPIPDPGEALALTVPAALVEALAAAVSERILARLHTTTAAESWPEWMAIETAARYLDVSPQRLRKLVAQRRIPYHQEDKGCRILFRRRDLDDWMSSFHIPARHWDIPSTELACVNQDNSHDDD
jgi:excisionase family DNA binding protein